MGDRSIESDRKMGEIDVSLWGCGVTRGRIAGLSPLSHLEAKPLPYKFHSPKTQDMIYLSKGGGGGGHCHDVIIPFLLPPSGVNPFLQV